MGGRAEVGALTNNGAWAQRYPGNVIAIRSVRQTGPFMHREIPRSPDLDFTALAPTGIATMAFTPIHAAVALPVPPWVKGVRVHASTNKKEALLEASPGQMVMGGDGMPVPWPFPWYLPEAKRG
jgi:hypothetical protein